MTYEEALKTKYNVELEYYEIAAIVAGLQSQGLAFEDPQTKRAMMRELGNDWKYAEMADNFNKKLIDKLSTFKASLTSYFSLQ